MKTRTDKELKQFEEMINMCSFNYAKSKKYGDHTGMDEFLRMFAMISNLLNSEGYYVEKVGTDHFDNLDVTYSTYGVRKSDL